MAMALAFIAVEGAGFETAKSEFFVEFFDAVFGTAENEDFVEAILSEEIVELINFLVLVDDANNILVDVFGGGLLFDRDGDGIVDESVENFGNFGGNSGGEK